MLRLERAFKFIDSGDNGSITVHPEEGKVIVFERGNMFWVFNFCPEKGFANYWVGVEWYGGFRYVISRGDEKYSGFKRVDTNTHPQSYPESYQGKKCKIELHLLSRMAFFLWREQIWEVTNSTPISNAPKKKR
jgi:hypothetical protein